MYKVISFFFNSNLFDESKEYLTLCLNHSSVTRKNNVVPTILRFIIYCLNKKSIIPFNLTPDKQCNVVLYK